MSRRHACHVLMVMSLAAVWSVADVLQACAQPLAPNQVSGGAWGAVAVAVPNFAIGGTSSGGTIVCKCGTDPRPSDCKVCGLDDSKLKEELLNKLLRRWCQAVCWRDNACLAQLFGSTNPIGPLPEGVTQEACEVGFTESGIATINADTIKGTVRKADTFTNRSRPDGPRGSREMSLYFWRRDGCWIMKIES